MFAASNTRADDPGSQYTLRMRCRACPGTSHVGVTLPATATTKEQIDQEVRRACKHMLFVCARCDHSRGALTAYFPTKQ